MSVTELSNTLAVRAAAAIERAILSGELAPDSKLVIQDLAEHYRIGATPIREGLSRLVARGIVVAIGQRGFRVARVSREDLEDIIRIRGLVEVEALQLSMRHGGDAWEAEIVAALHRLRRLTARGGSVFDEGHNEFDSVHKAFHTALIAACGSPRMLELASQLYDQSYRYRRVMMLRFDAAAGFIAEHQKLADLVLARNEERACAALRRHFRLTLGNVYPPMAAKIRNSIQTAKRQQGGVRR